MCDQEGDDYEPSKDSRIAIIHPGIQGTLGFAISSVLYWVREVRSALKVRYARPSSIDYRFCLQIRPCGYQQFKLRVIAVFGCAYERRFALHNAAQISARSSRRPPHAPTSNSALLSDKTDRPPPPQPCNPASRCHSLALTSWKPHRAGRPSQVRSREKMDSANEQRARVQRTSYNRILGSKRITQSTSSKARTSVVAKKSASCPYTA